MTDQNTQTREERQKQREADRAARRAERRNNSAGARRSNNSGGDQQKAQVWLNPGLDLTNPETGEVEFVGLPMGIPIDTQKPARGNTPMMQGKNGILEMLQEEGEKLEPGEEVEVNLTLKLRRVATPEDTGETDPNSFKSQLGGFTLRK